MCTFNMGLQPLMIAAASIWCRFCLHLRGLSDFAYGLLGFILTWVVSLPTFRTLDLLARLALTKEGDLFLMLLSVLLIVLSSAAMAAFAAGKWFVERRHPSIPPLAIETDEN